MLARNAASLFGVLKSIQEHYFSGIRKTFANVMEENRNYEREEKSREHAVNPYEELPELCWCFDESGLYAAAVHMLPERNMFACKDLSNTELNISLHGKLLPLKKPDAYLCITIYDCLEKTAYDYLKELSYLKPDYFYWFEGTLVLVIIKDNTEIQLLQLTLDHDNRKAVLVNTRNHVVPLDTAYGSAAAWIRRIRPNRLIKNIGTLFVNGQEYISLMDRRNCIFLLTPKDPSSELPIRISDYMFDETQEHLVNGIQRLAIPPIPYGQYLYFPRIRTPGNRTVKYYFDTFMELDLEQLENKAGKLVDIPQAETSPSAASKEVLFEQIGTVPRDISEPMNMFSAKRLSSGQILAVAQEVNTRRCYSCHIDVSKNQITWQRWIPNIQRNSKTILACLHPSGHFLEINYKNKKDVDKYSLFCESVGLSIQPIRLKTMCLFKLFTSEVPMQSNYNWLRLIL